MKEYVFHSFRMGDVDDPEIYAAAPIYEWQKTEQGRWCMANTAGEPHYNTFLDYKGFGYRCVIYGRLSETDHTYYQLKWGNRDNLKN